MNAVCAELPILGLSSGYCTALLGVDKSQDRAFAYVDPPTHTFFGGEGETRSLCGPRDNFSGSGFRAVQSYDDPTNDCGSKSDTEGG